MTVAIQTLSVIATFILYLQLIISQKMASNTTLKSYEEEIITCPICLNILENPRRLDCLHSFCDKCLKKVDLVVEKERKGILCPLCRKFTSEPNIKKDPILEVLVGAFSQYLDKNFLNKDPLEKFCNQCDTRINVTSYCVECKAELCHTCQTRHLRFEAMSEHRIVPIADTGTHPVVNITKYCPKHVTKPIKLSCVSCKLAICLQCKVEDHDTHKTEDVPSALASVLPELRTSIPRLDAEKEKQVEAMHDLDCFVKEVAVIGREILCNAEKARDELMSRAMSDYKKIQETVTNFVQSVTKEASLQEDDANNSIKSIDSMSSWIKVLANVTEGPAILFEVRNERLLDRVTALLRECREFRDVRKLQNRATRKPRLRQTSLECENVVGIVQFEEAFVTSTATGIASGLHQTYSSSQYSPVTEETTHTVPSTESTIEVKSFRQTDTRLCEVKGVKKRGSFKLASTCFRICYHQETLWCLSYNKIDIYTLEGRLQMSTKFPYLSALCAVHPLTLTRVLLSAQCGLYLYDTTQQAISHTLRKGLILDVHASGTHIVALKRSHNKGDLVHVFSTTDPPAHSHSFHVNHSHALRVMIHNRRVYVSVRDKGTFVYVYTVEGQTISQYQDCRIEEVSLHPYLCAVDGDGRLVIAEYQQDSFLLTNRRTYFIALKDVDACGARDIVIVGKDLYVLYYLSPPDVRIRKYELC